MKLNLHSTSPGPVARAKIHEVTVEWPILCKRTDDPKLAWLETKLSEAGIPSIRKGRSFHAPILRVRDCDMCSAWAILADIDDVPDDDPRFGPTIEREVLSECCGAPPEHDLIGNEGRCSHCRREATFE